MALEFSYSVKKVPGQQFLAVVKISTHRGRANIVFSHQDKSEEWCQNWVDEWRRTFEADPPKVLRDLLNYRFHRSNRR